jgi:suppressor of cytokine signaling 7
MGNSQAFAVSYRFVILKLVRRDLIPTLPLPRRVIDYLSTPHYYSEQLVVEDDLAASPDHIDMFAFVPQGLS